MQRYGNRSGDSGVEAYAEEPDAIRVRFRGSPRVYRYSHRSAGHEAVDTMKRLARSGRGLSTFISRHASDLHER